MTRQQIIDRLQANGNPSIFEEAVLNYIRELEAEIRGLRSIANYSKEEAVLYKQLFKLEVKASN